MRRNRFKRRRGKKPQRFRKYIEQGVRISAGFLGLILMSFALMTGHDFLTRCRYFSATAIQINGLNRLTASEVLNQADIEKGVNIMAVNLPLIRKRLMAHPWIADVSVRRRLPAVLALSVIDQVPLAVVDLGRKFVINQQGDIFKKAGSTDLKNFPIISGLSYSDLNLYGQPAGSTISSVLAILKLGNEHDSTVPNSILRKVHVDREIGLTLFAFNRPLVIRLGYTNYPAKYEVLAQVLTYFNTHRADLEIDWIDLNDPERIVMNLKGELTQKTDKEV